MDEIKRNCENKKKKVYLVGAGPGAMDLITLRGRKLIEKSDVLIYDALAGNALIELAPAHCRKIYVGKRAGQHSMKQEEISALLVKECKPELTVVRLKGGDSFVFGRGGEEIEALLKAGIDYELVPGITSAVAAPELCGIPVTHRGMAGSFTVLTGHTRDDGITTEQFDMLAGLLGTIVILMGVKNGGAIAKGLIDAGKSPDTPIAFIENASLPEQKLVRGNLSEVEQLVAEGKVHAPAVLVIGKVASFPANDKLGHNNVGSQGIGVNPTCSGRRAIAVAGTEHFVKHLKEHLRQSKAPDTEVKLVDCHNLEIKPILEHLPKEVQNGRWLLFTSGYGVTNFIELCQKDRIDLRKLSKFRFAVIGKDTAAYLEQYGIYPDFVSTRAEGYAFGKEFAAFAKEVKDVVLLRAQKASKGLPKALEEEGVSFTDIALYDTFPIEKQTKQLLNELADDNSDYAGVVMGSRSAAEALFGTVTDKEQLQKLICGKKLFGMGNGTKDYLTQREISSEQILIPQSPAIANLIKLIQEAYDV